MQGTEFRLMSLPDRRWPGMYRLVQPGGSLSDMVNLTRVEARSNSNAGMVCGAEWVKC
jgi:hypothetical protein